jgi:hypothetical protein
MKEVSSVVDFALLISVEDSHAARRAQSRMQLLLQPHGTSARFRGADSARIMENLFAPVGVALPQEGSGECRVPVAPAAARVE